MHSILRSAFLVTSAAFLAGCIATQPKSKVVVLQSRFDSEEASAALAKGNSTIKGSALLRQMGGGVVTCAGNDVTLVPATSYSRERIRALYGSPEGGYRPIHAGDIDFQSPPATSTAALYSSLVHRSVCDAQGYFKFANIKDGEYYAVTAITWSIRTGAYTTSNEGGTLSRRVTVLDGEIKEIVLTAN